VYCQHKVMNQSESKSCKILDIVPQEKDPKIGGARA
jgi:hypothetical protein